MHNKGLLYTLSQKKPNNKQTVNYPTNMKPQEAYFIQLLRVIVASIPYGLNLCLSKCLKRQDIS